MPAAEEQERSEKSAAQAASQSHVQGHLQEHIDLIAKHEQEFLDQRTSIDKVGDRLANFIGSFTYVTIHIVFSAVWIAWNVSPIASMRRFDPFPFPFLDFVYAFEAILVASFIMMRQSRVGRRSEERDHLMLQILLLTERELTAVLGMERQIAERLGLYEAAHEQEITELSEHTSIDEVAQNIKESLPTE